MSRGKVLGASSRSEQRVRERAHARLLMVAGTPGRAVDDDAAASRTRPARASARSHPTPAARLGIMGQCQWTFGFRYSLGITCRAAENKCSKIRVRAGWTLFEIFGNTVHPEIIFLSFFPTLHRSRATLESHLMFLHDIPPSL